MDHGSWWGCLGLFALTCLLAACGATGAQPTPPAQFRSPPHPLMPTGTVVTLPPTPPPPPTERAPLLATPTIAPTAAPGAPVSVAMVNPGLSGLITDFFLAVAYGDEAKARRYLPPGLYRDAPTLRQAFGLPRFPPGPTGVSSSLNGPIGSPMTVETEVQYDTRVVRARVTLVQIDADHWQIIRVEPHG